MNKKEQRYRSDAAAAAHETVSDLYEIGLVNKKTMKEFDKSCLVPIEMTPEEIKALRLRENVSQPVFATYLNVSRNLISDWERGVKHPGGPALRLLDVVKRHGIDILL